jgi:TRAP-type mannitol/chloroaromatic compound transport system permease small subunit
MKIKIHFIYLAVFTVLIKFPINLNLSFNELFIISNYYMNGSYLLDIFHTLKYCMPLLVIMLFVMLDINNIEENKWIISSRIGGNKKLKRYINKIVLMKSL